MVNGYAVIEQATGLVVNCCLWDGVTEWAPPRGCYAVKIPNGERVDLGDTFNGVRFIPKPAPLPDNEE